MPMNTHALSPALHCGISRACAGRECMLQFILQEIEASGVGGDGATVAVAIGGGGQICFQAQIKWPSRTARPHRQTGRRRSWRLRACPAAAKANAHKRPTGQARQGSAHVNRDASMAIRACSRALLLAVCHR